ncbi:uncharacterized protein LOC116309003 [Actinia tenebrosa]|uniref:Uncharacterized protein LOC116309003 n=1 Tax=Actinia tenebrosa TaxID=6105 RepID=A0A6P8J6K1_ACTTE|nr:uncharacterized protein LOC116309003 [Actinia tenebrosa]
MRGKQAHSEADGLFMKANRKHQILLNFELKRISVEQKMRERYFAFEKSLIISHREKIISRQKSLGIYRPQTTPDKKRPRDSFFITAVAMETKARMKLPPVERKDTRDGATKGKRKPTKTKLESNSKSFTNVGQERHKEDESLPVLKQTFAIQARKDSSSLRASTMKNLAVSTSLDKNPGESQHFVSNGKAERQTREGQGEEIPDGSIEKAWIENKRTENDLKDQANGEKKVEDIGIISEPQTGSNVEQIEVKQGDVATKKKKESNEEHLLKDTTKDAEFPEKEVDAGENISENKEQNSAKSKTFKQSDEDSLHETQRRSKSVLSGVMDERRTKVIDVNLRAQSAGVQGRGTKIESSSNGCAK